LSIYLFYNPNKESSNFKVTPVVLIKQSLWSLSLKYGSACIIGTSYQKVNEHSLYPIFITVFWIILISNDLMSKEKFKLREIAKKF